MVLNNKKEWSPVELRLLKSMAQHGYSANRIARDLGRTPTAVIYQAKKKKLRIAS